MVGGAPDDASLWQFEQVQAALKEGLVRGKSPSSLAREISAQSGWKRREVYRIVTEMDKELIQKMRNGGCYWGCTIIQNIWSFP